MKMENDSQSSQIVPEEMVESSGCTKRHNKIDSISKRVYTVTEQHVVNMQQKKCTCVEDYLYEGPCRHRRLAAKKITESESRD
jgi:hypothetical protein